MNKSDQKINDIIGQEFNDISSALEGLTLRDELLGNNGDLLKKIGIFVLLIGKLEDRIKTILLFTVNSPPNERGMTLGVAIKELENRLPKMRDAYILSLSDYRYKNFLQGENVQIFISQCYKLNDLRNDLIHNFVSPHKSELKNILQVLNYMEKMLVGVDNWESYKRLRISQEVLKGQKTKDNLVRDQLHIRTHEGIIRDDLPLGGLIEICDIFYRTLKQLKR